MAGQARRARSSGTSFEESPFSSKTSRYPLSGAQLAICGLGDDCGQFRSPHLKWCTPHNPENERREPVSVLLRITYDFANGRSIVILDASSQGEGHQVLRQSCDEQFRTVQQRLFQSIDSPKVL